MRTVRIVNPIWPDSCEKITLFRHDILWLKIAYAPIIQSRMGKSITFSVPVTDQFQLKTDISGPDSPFINNKKWQRHD